MAVEYHFSGTEDNRIFLAAQSGISYELTMGKDGTLLSNGDNLTYVNISGDTITGNLLLANGVDVIPVSSGNSDLGSASAFFGTIYANNIVGGAAGEDNTASNIGGDEGLFWQKTGVDLEFRGITAGTEITLSSGNTAVTINAPGIVTNATDIAFVSGTTDTNATNIAANTSSINFVSGVTATNATNIAANTANITFISGNYIKTSQRGANNGVASLNAQGKVPNAQIPAIAITETYVVDSSGAQVALAGSGADIGDVAVRSDESQSYILAVSGGAALLSNWQLLLTPTDAVLSVNGQTGVVVLDTDDVAEGSSNLYYTEGRVSANVTVVANQADIAFVSGTTDTNATNIATNIANITFISGNYVSSASNLLEGEGVFKQKTGNDLEFKGITGVGNISVSSDANSIVISGTDSGTQDNFVFAFASGTQTLALPSVFQPITMDVAPEINGWTNIGGTGSVFTCGLTAKYIVTYTAQYQKTSGGNVSYEFRATFNGTEVFGSQRGVLVVSNNEGRAFSQTFILNGVSGQNLEFQQEGNSNRAEITPLGNTATTRPSFTVTISKA